LCTQDTRNIRLRLYDGIHPLTKLHVHSQGLSEVSLKQEKPPQWRGILCYQFVIKKCCRRSESNWHGVTPTGFWVSRRAYQ